MANNVNPFNNPEPLDLGNMVETPDLKNISYTAFDYYSIKNRTKEYIQKYFPNDYNNFVESDLGMMLIELWAFMADLISFKIDMYVNEVFIDTVSQKKNIYRIAKLVGYPIRSPRAATCRISASLAAAYTFNVKINPGYSLMVPSKDGTFLNFELYAADEEWNPLYQNDIIIPAGSINNLSIIAIEGTSGSDTLISDGTKYQTFTIQQTSILDGSISVYVNNQRWTQVEFFNESDPGPYYTVDYDENYRARITFGDDVKAKIPPQGFEIVINYRFGGGERGNIDSGFIEQIANITSNEIPGSIPVIIRNYTQGEGGESAESMEEIKSKLPVWVKAQNRAVSGEDYSFLSESFSTQYHGRIGKALAALRNSGCSGNIIDIYVLQMDGTNSLKTASITLKKELQNYMSDKKMLTDYLCIKDASQVYQDIIINITVNKFYSQYKKDVYDKVQDKTNEFFDLSRWRIGQPFRKYDLVQYLNSIGNIVSTEVILTPNPQNLSGGTDVLVVDFWKIIRPGNININIDTAI